MRLLNTETLQLEAFSQELLPEYAILSHRWGDEEVSFQDLQAGLGKGKRGLKKIERFCHNARSRGFDWCWVDTCGIDKTSSAELSESINSMYNWYRDSTVCFVYLQDIHAMVHPDGSYTFPEFNRSTWFTRGWTLQEFIAPYNVEFYSSEWIYIGDKISMAQELSIFTGIDEDVLLGSLSPRLVSTAKRMSWASHRKTSRKEDIAYCLLGLFDIHMPLLYGEGDRAFIRLQEELLKQSSDQSLFAWNPIIDEDKKFLVIGEYSLCGILAPSPACFAETGDILPLVGLWDTESTLTNRGVRLRIPLEYDSRSKTFAGLLCCKSSSNEQEVAIELHSTSHSLQDGNTLIRRTTPVRYGRWSHFQHVELHTVYLASKASLWETALFSGHSIKPPFHLLLLLQDMGQFTNLDGSLQLYPPEALSDDCCTDFKEVATVRKIAELDPLKVAHSSVAILIPTKLSQNVALIVGFKILRSGLPDIRHPWLVIMSISENLQLENAWFDGMALQPHSDDKQSMDVTIDGVRITAVFAAESWSNWNGRCIVITCISV